MSNVPAAWAVSRFARIGACHCPSPVLVSLIMRWFVLLAAAFVAPIAMSDSPTDSAPDSADADSGAVLSSTDWPPLPSAATSFGAAVLDRSDGRDIYLYGGHVGNAHSYSTSEQTGNFYRLRISDAGDVGQWESFWAC